MKKLLSCRVPQRIVLIHEGAERPDYQRWQVFPGGILKVDSFINHQMDASLMRSMAVEFVRRFASARINKIIRMKKDTTRAEAE